MSRRFRTKRGSLFVEFRRNDYRPRVGFIRDALGWYFHTPVCWVSWTRRVF